MFFFQNKFEKIFSIIFKYFQPNLLDFCQKNDWFYMILANWQKKKKIPKMENLSWLHA